MTDNINEEDYKKLKKVLDKTLHRFKNNLQTQLSLMNIQIATKRLYFDERKVIVDRMFALTHIYDLYYRNYEGQTLKIESQISLQSFMLKLYQHFNSTSNKIEFITKEIENVNVDVDDLLILSYILIEFSDFNQSLDDKLTLEISKNEKNVLFTFSFSGIVNHVNFYKKLENQFKILDLLVRQLKGSFDYENKFVKLSFPIL